VQKPKIVGRKEPNFQSAKSTQKFTWAMKFDGEFIDDILEANLSKINAQKSTTKPKFVNL